MAYAIAPVKGIADVLNEAADANDRTMESDRRTALTAMQIQGEQQRQKLALSADARAQEVHGYAMDEAKFAQEKRNKERELGNAMVDIGKRWFTKQVPDETAPVAAMPDVTGQPGSAIPERPTKTIPVDLSGPEGFKTIMGYQNEVMAKRIQLGLMTPDELQKAVAFNEQMEKTGRTKLFEKAVMGDQLAADELGKQFGYEPGTVKITKGFDKSGSPDIFMTTTKVVDGKTVTSQQPIGHLAALMSPTVYEALVSKPLAVQKDVAAIKHYNDTGSAAITNANANAANAKSAADLRKKQGNFYDARAAAIADGGDTVNTAAHKTSLYSSYTDSEGKNLVLPSAATNKARIAAQAEAMGMTRKQAAHFADQEWAGLTSGRKQWESLARDEWEKSNGKKSPNNFKTGMQFEDAGLSTATTAFINSQTDNGLAAKAKAFMARKSRALNDKDPGEDTTE